MTIIYAQVPQELIFDKSITSRHRDLYSAMASYASHSGREFWGDLASLVDRLDFSLSSAYSYLSDLIDVGWIELVRRRKRAPSVYRLAWNCTPPPPSSLESYPPQFQAGLESHTKGEQTTKKEQTTPEVSSVPSADGMGGVKQSCCSLLASPEKQKAPPTPVIDLPTAFAALESGAKNIIRGLKLEEASRILIAAAEKIDAGGVRNPLGYLASLRTALMEGRFFDAEALREKEAAEEAEKKRRWKQFEIGLEMAELEDERIATEAAEAEHIKVQKVLDTKCEEELIEIKARFVEGLETIKRTKKGNVFSASRALKAIGEGDWGARMVRSLWSGYVAEYG